MLEAVVWVAVGAAERCSGPCSGRWHQRAEELGHPGDARSLLLLLGSLFIVVTLFFPGGVVGIPARSGRSATGGAGGRPLRRWRGPGAPPSQPQPGPGTGAARRLTMHAAGIILGLAGVSKSFDGFKRSTISRSTWTRGSCARSSAPTEPARVRCWT